MAELQRAGSSLKFCLIARGDADVYPRIAPTMEWDTAAGHAILNAAGGCVLGLDGSPLRYGKKDAGFKNAGFIAWGRRPRNRLPRRRCRNNPIFLRRDGPAGQARG